MSDPSERLRDEVAGVLWGHRRDSMSQDSGNHCECGSDSRFEQRGGDHPWGTFPHHLADALMPLLARVRDEAKAEALREAADAYDPATEHQARGWVQGWLLDRAEAVGGQNGPLRGQGGPSTAETTTGPLGRQRGAEGRAEGEMG